MSYIFKFFNNLYNQIIHAKFFVPVYKAGIGPQIPYDDAPLNPLVNFWWKFYSVVYHIEAILHMKYHIFSFLILMSPALIGLYFLAWLGCSWFLLNLDGLVNPVVWKAREVGRFIVDKFACFYFFIFMHCKSFPHLFRGLHGSYFFFFILFTFLYVLASIQYYSWYFGNYKLGDKYVEKPGTRFLTTTPPGRLRWFLFFLRVTVSTVIVLAVKHPKTFKALVKALAKVFS